MSADEELVKMARDAPAALVVGGFFAMLIYIAGWIAVTTLQTGVGIAVLWMIGLI